jgi:hypothetical protein
MATPEFPFHDGPDDSQRGRAFWIFTTREHEHEHAANLIDSLAGGNFGDQQLAIMYRIYRDIIRAMNAEQGVVPHVPPVVQYVPPPAAPAVIVPEAFPEENRITEFADRFKCSICLENAVNTRLNPCGHLLCNACFNLLPVPKQCPICRRDVIDDQHIFYGGAKEKYLKYKSKYLALKNKLKN